MNKWVVFGLSLGMVACLPKRELEGKVLDYVDLPLSSPTVTYAEVDCPGADKSDDPLTGRMYRQKEGDVEKWLMNWSGGDSAYMSRFVNSWRYSPTDSGIGSLLALTRDKDLQSGTAYFFLEGMGGGLWFGNLVLLPDGGKRAFGLTYLDRGDGKMKISKVDGTYRVAPIPTSIPRGGMSCYDVIDESWPRQMAAHPITMTTYGGGGVSKAYLAGDVEGAERLWHAGGYADILRYGGEELETLLMQWSMMDRFAGDLPLDGKEPGAAQAAVWEQVQAKYQAVLDAGDGPPPVEAGTPSEDADSESAEPVGSEPVAE